MNPNVHVRAVLVATIGLLIVAMAVLGYRASTAGAGSLPTSVSVSER